MSYLEKLGGNPLYSLGDMEIENVSTAQSNSLVEKMEMMYLLMLDLAFNLLQQKSLVESFESLLVCQTSQSIMLDQKELEAFTS